MTPIQQILLGVGASKKTYMDDVFSTYLHAGNETVKSIVNGVDLTKGGLVWTKTRSHAGHNYLFDTERGVTKYIKTNQDNVEGYDNNTLTSFNNNGFSLGVDTSQNENGRTFSTWSFRKAKGFFDVVTWVGNETNRTISHSLGCVPGCIIIKCIDDNKDWTVYHRSTGAEKRLKLNDNIAEYDNDIYFQDTEPTSTSFSIGTSADVNGMDGGTGLNYVAYLFAGGESTAATARSVDFDGTGDVLSLAASDDFHCTGDVTIECWVKPDGYSTYDAIWGHGMYNQTNGVLFYAYNDQLRFYKGGADRLTLPLPKLGQWTHIAMVRSGSKVSVYMNGTEEGSYTDSDDFGTSSNKTFHVGSGYNDSSGGTNVDFWNGKISNFRFIKGTALYTSSFRPPTEPLANVTNTKLLCCNNSSTTGSTVTPGTITANGDPTASTDSPFDDPAGFKFGDSKEGIIKCGSYVGNGSATGPKVYLGWEPQYLLIKRSDAISHWYVLDSMRGFNADGVNDKLLSPNQTNASDGQEWEDNYYGISATGFNPNTTSATFNGNNGTYVYIAIRRPDGYVGKPAETATDVFAMDSGSSANIPPGSFDSGFPVDFALYRQHASAGNWMAPARLTHKKAVETNTNYAESADSGAEFDSNTGWYDGASGTYQSWMWKRHAGFDVVTYKGNESANKTINHSLGKTPEMIWVKRRESPQSWGVYHKGLNGGSSPEDYYLSLDTNAAEVNSATAWNSQAPTSTSFFLGSSSITNSNIEPHLAMLFASVDGISSVGSYSGSSSNVSVTTGFQPRFIIIKRCNVAAHWAVFDTVRGINSSGSGGDYLLYLNDNMAGTDANGMIGTWIDLSSTGFTVGGWAGVNGDGSEYIYYAHA